MNIDDTDGQAGTTQDEGSEAEESTEQGTVSIHEATDEELEAFLTKATPDEGTPEGDGEEAGESSGEPDVKKQASTKSETAAPKEETDSKVEDSEKDSPDTQQINQELAEKVEHQARLLAQQELMIKRRGTELGALRDQLDALIAEKRANVKALAFEDPAAAVEQQLEIRDLEKQKAEAQNEEEGMVRIHESMKLVASHVKPGEATVDEIAEILEKEDNLDPRAIAAFKANPYSFMDAGTIVQAAKRVAERKEKHKAIYWLKKLYEENQALKAQTKSAPRDVLGKVEKALRQSPPIVAGNANGGSKSRGVDLSKIPELDDAALNRLLEEQS